MNIRGVGLLIVACVWLGAGCSSPGLRGTPFYTQEDGPLKDPDRIPLWPVLYYESDLVLSVLWPIFEGSRDHMAIRPLCSVYDRDTATPVYNFLWPLGEWETGPGNVRLFPFSAGPDHLSLFPLYWHGSDPGAGSVYDALFPAWWYQGWKEGSDLYVAGPILHWVRTSDRNGWHVWPLAGHYANRGSEYDFFAWPLGHRWTRTDSSERSSTLLPLYYGGTSDGESYFYSLPFGTWRHDDGSDGGHFVTPLYWTRLQDEQRELWTLAGGFCRQRDGVQWAVWPAASWGHAAGSESDTWVAGPLMHRYRAGADYSEHIFPVYYRSRIGDRQTLATPLYWTGQERRESWNALVPFYYHRQGESGDLWLTLLGGHNGEGSAESWYCFPLLSSIRTQGAEQEIWFLAPLIHAVRHADGTTTQQALPVYYRDSRAGTLLTPLYSQWRKGTGAETRVIPPLLSWKTESADRKDYWIAGTLAHVSSGPQAGSSHVFPLYYRHPGSGLTLSPLWCTWQQDSRRWSSVPPLLSASWQDGGGSGLEVLLGLAHHEWDREGSTRDSMVLPLYLYEPGRRFLSLLCGWNRDPVNGYRYVTTPLAGQWTGREKGYWLFPLWSRSEDETAQRVKGSFLWGGWEETPTTRRSGILPFYGYEETVSGVSSGRPPESVSRHFWSLPACWSQTATRPAGRFGKTETQHREHGFFPFWSYSGDEAPATGARVQEFSALVCLYDWERDWNPKPGGSDYTRSRVLWRLWHYEREGGNVSVDAFPGITYDRREDGFRKASFLWRVFRHENGPEGRKIDLLFLPVYRGKAAGGEA